jgi:hypothetical protein
MSNDVIISTEIDCTRKQLEKIVQQNQYNFNHPDVIAISEKLDHLILKMMKKDSSS